MIEINKAYRMEGWDRYSDSDQLERVSRARVPTVFILLYGSAIVLALAVGYGALILFVEVAKLIMEVL